MLHTKFRGNWSTGSGEDNLGHVTSIMLIRFHFHVLKSLLALHSKFGLKWPSDF